MVKKKESKGIPLVRWKNILKFEEDGGWGLKNIHYFGNTLETKSLWRKLKLDCLWKLIIE
jgi:hypothetical protein